MSARRIYLIVLLLVAGCQQAGSGANKPAPSADNAIAEPELGKQLKINRDALLKGTSEQIRIDAATVMLFSIDPIARETLLAVLKQDENIAAQMAICKALSQARAAQESIKQKDDFIEPLFDILTVDDFVGAKLAAEASLIFEYEQISSRLEKIVTEPSLPAAARLNAIYALKLQPDMRAIFKLIELLDDPQSQVAAAAEDALKALGIPAGKDAKTRKQIIEELKRKGRDEFLRDWLIRQEAQMRKLETELDLWQKMYLSALGKIYDGISEDAARGVFLAEHLAGSKSVVRLWALEMVSQWRVGTASELPAELGPVLVNLISDNDRNVRLKTAQLLSLMGQLNSTEKLLEQIQAERDDQVRMELFVALGGACYYAFLPNSGINVSPEIRKKTLELAAEYLSQQEPKKAQKGAEVIKKLLEQNGLSQDEVGVYLDLLVERYNRQKNKPNRTLSGELLNAMAGLCAQSVYKTESARRFAPLFEEALRDETNLVREAAVDGLIYIDKVRALKILRKDFVNDSSATIRKKLIELAGETGLAEQLPWLAEKIGSTAEGEPAWQAMLKIFKRSDTAVLSEWLNEFSTGLLTEDSQSTKARLSDEQRISFLKIAERKAAGENRAKMLETVREKLARLYSKNGEFEQAAEYLGMLRETADTPEQKEAILARLLEVYLRWPNVEATVQLVNNCLLAGDLEPNDVVVRSIESYLNEPSAASEPNIVLVELAKIKTTQPRPVWQRQLKLWQKRFRVQEPNSPGQPSD